MSIVSSITVPRVPPAIYLEGHIICTIRSMLWVDDEQYIDSRNAYVRSACILSSYVPESVNFFKSQVSAVVRRYLTTYNRVRATHDQLFHFQCDSSSDIIIAR